MAKARGDIRDNPLIIGPVLTRPGADTMTVLWETERESAGAITYAQRGKSKVTASDRARDCLHRITLGELTPGSVYDYSVISEGRVTFRGTFRTLPEKGPYRVAIIGDLHAPAEGFKKLVSHIDNQRPDFIVILGDLVSSGRNKECWLSFFEMAGMLLDHVPFLSIIGNHDAKHGTALFDRYVGRHNGTPEGFYYFTAQVTSDYFIFLDSRNDMLFFHHGFWLIRTLRGLLARNDIRHVFVFAHLGPVSYKGLRRGFIGLKPLLPLMGRAGVSAIFSGHDHHYMRGRTHWGFPFFISGGGGGKVYPVNQRSPYAWLVGKKELWKETHEFLIMDIGGGRDTVRALDDRGTVIDEVVLSPTRK